MVGNHQPAEVYDKIDVKMDQRRLKQREKKMREQIKELFFRVRIVGSTKQQVFPI